MTQCPVPASLWPMHKRPLLTYIALAYLWTWVTVLPLLLQKRGLVDLGLPDAWEAVGAFGPLVAAWLVVRRTEGAAGLAAFWRSLTNWRLGAGAWSLTLLSPLAFLALAAALVTVQTGAPPSLDALATGRLGPLRASALPGLRLGRVGPQLPALPPANPEAHSPGSTGLRQRASGRGARTGI